VTGALRVRVRVPERDVDLALEVAAGETVAVLGPNGAGKSTLLGAIAGLVRAENPDGASVRLSDRPLDGVPPHDRGVALLAQDPLLFPHLSVLENVAFAPRATGVRRAAAHARAREQLATVGAADLAGRRPARLSGGQAQRVAIARALAAEPELLLLDEPMAALDASVAPALRQTLRRVLAGRTALIVTHDVLDALLLADRVVVIEGGRITEDGPTQQVLTAPRSAFAARLAGLDLLAGTWDGEALTTPGGLRVHGTVGDGSPADQPLAAGPATALFRPAAVSVFTEPPGGSPRNALPATVTDLEPLGDRVRVHAALTEPAPARGVRDEHALLAADVTPAAVADLGLSPGLPVTFSVKATEVSIYGSFQSSGAP